MRRVSRTPVGDCAPPPPSALLRARSARPRVRTPLLLADLRRRRRQRPAARRRPARRVRLEGALPDHRGPYRHARFSGCESNPRATPPRPCHRKPLLFAPPADGALSAGATGRGVAPQRVFVVGNTRRTGAGGLRAGRILFSRRRTRGRTRRDQSAVQLRAGDAGADGRWLPGAGPLRCAARPSPSVVGRPRGRPPRAADSRVPVLERKKSRQTAPGNRVVAGARLAPGAPAKTIVQARPAARMRAISVTYHDVVQSGRFRDGGFEGGDAGRYKLDGDV